MRGLPNLWSLCNLQGSPYFQTTLGAASPRYPLSLRMSVHVEGPFRTKAMVRFGGCRWSMSDEGDGAFRIMAMAV